MIALRASIRRPVVAGSSSTQLSRHREVEAERRVSGGGGVLSFSRTLLFASAASATYQTAPQLTSVPLMAGGASRQSPHARRELRADARRTDRPNQRAALHQAAQRFCRTRFLKLAFRGLRSTAALASTPTTANAASAWSRRTATTTSEPMQDPAETLQVVSRFFWS